MRDEDMTPEDLEAAWRNAEVAEIVGQARVVTRDLFFPGATHASLVKVSPVAGRTAVTFDSPRAFPGVTSPSATPYRVA